MVTLSFSLTCKHAGNTVENMGCANYGKNLKEPKGITQWIWLNNQYIYHWGMYKFEPEVCLGNTLEGKGMLNCHYPRIFKGIFTSDSIGDCLYRFLAKQRAMFLVYPHLEFRCIGRRYASSVEHIEIDGASSLKHFIQHSSCILPSPHMMLSVPMVNPVFYSYGWRIRLKLFQLFKSFLRSRAKVHGCKNIGQRSVFQHIRPIRCKQHPGNAAITHCISQKSRVGGILTITAIQVFRTPSFVLHILLGFGRSQ